MKELRELLSIPMTSNAMDEAIRFHKLSVPMVAVLTAVAKEAGFVGSWTMKNVILHGIDGANANTVKALESRGILETRVQENAGRGDSLTAYALTPRGIELAVIFIGDQAVVTEHTMSNGDIAYRAECLHGWATGLHAESNDAADVAKGHGDVSRPLYESAAVTEDTHKRRILAQLAEHRRIFVAESHNFGPASVFDAMVASFTIFVIGEGDMARYVAFPESEKFDLNKVIEDYAADRDAYLASLPGGDAPVSAVERPRFSKVKNTSRARRYRRGA